MLINNCKNACSKMIKQNQGIIKAGGMEYGHGNIGIYSTQGIIFYGRGKSFRLVME